MNRKFNLRISTLHRICLPKTLELSLKQNCGTRLESSKNNMQAIGMCFAVEFSEGSKKERRKFFLRENSEFVQ